MSRCLLRGGSIGQRYGELKSFELETAMLEDSEFRADWVSAPGETIEAILTERGIDFSRFAEQLGLPLLHVNELLQGRQHITEDVAYRLSITLGASQRFWAKREAQYRSSLAELREYARTLDCQSWLANLPLPEMREYRWIDGAEPAVECLRFFGIRDVNSWNNEYASTLATTAFRTSKSFTSDQAAVATWIRQAELQAGKLKLAAWDPNGFHDNLPSIRSLTRISDPKQFVPKLIEMCAGFGLAVVLLRAPSKCKASGVARFMAGNRPMIVLSARHLSDDHLWFTFFHECGHILLHPYRSIFVDGVGCSETSKEEDEANAFSEDILVPDQYKKELFKLSANKIDVMRFARKIGVSRGIVVGQLQHYGRLDPDQLNGLKYRFSWDG